MIRSFKLPSDFSPEPKQLHRWPFKGYRDPAADSEEDASKHIKLLPHELAERVIMLRDDGGMPFTTEGRPYLLPIYDHWHPKMVIIGGRQIEKSTTLSNLVLVPAVTERGYRSLIVSPTDIHTSTFAYDKLDGTLNASPNLMKLLGGKPRVANLHHKEFKNTSSILLRSAYLTARSARGIPADQLLVDEAQDMIPDHLPVLAETLTHSHKLDFGRRIIIAGTALTPECMIGEYWADHSTQGEWVIKCSAGHDNIIEFENLSEKGLICSHKDNGTCAKLLNPINGRWVHMYPSRKALDLYVGYRIPQVINPMVFSHWKDIVAKLRTYSNARIQQEVLGRSYESGQKPISRSHLIRMERNKYSISSSQEYIEMPVMGVDWGYGDVSYTVVTIGGWNQRNNFQIIFSKKYRLGEEIEPDYQVEDILRLAHRFGIVHIGCDWGAGWGPNAQIRAKYGRMSDFIHSHGLKTFMKWSKNIGRYTINRTESMTSLFEAIKSGRVEAFQGYTDEHGQDYLNVNGTTDRFGHVIYTHAPSRPDDSVHSALYAYLIGRLMRREINPLIEE